MAKFCFCYRIAAAAGVAYNTETKEDTTAYAQITFDSDSLKDGETIEAKHKALGEALAKDYGWEPEWVTLISKEEHDRETVEDDSPTD